MGDKLGGDHHGDPRRRHAGHAVRKPRVQGTQGSPSFARGGLVLILASWTIVLIHLTELLIWPAFFLWHDAMPDASAARYFSLMQYTTVGSSFSLPQRWRLPDGMLPVAELLTFAWPTDVLFTLAQEFQSAQLSIIHQRREARRAERESSRRRRPEYERGGSS